MDAFTTSDIIMNCDLDDSDIDFSGDDFDIQTSNLESDDDAVQAASSAQLLTSQTREAARLVPSWEATASNSVHGDTRSYQFATRSKNVWHATLMQAMKCLQ